VIDVFEGELQIQAHLMHGHFIVVARINKNILAKIASSCQKGRTHFFFVVIRAKLLPVTPIFVWEL